MKLATAKTIKKIDHAAVSMYGMRSIQLMENAGAGVAGVAVKEFGGRIEGRKVAVIVGKGNNAGDGYVCARLLANMGARVTVFSLASSNELKGDCLLNERIWRQMHGEVRSIADGASFRNERNRNSLKHASIVVDAIFGTGLSVPVSGVYADAIKLINELGKKVVSIDIPSGIDATTGAVLGIAVKAAVTATMAMPKLGTYIYPGREYAGRLETIDIGCPACLLTDETIKENLVTGRWVAGILKKMRRPPDSHKGSFGHTLIIGGSTGKTGAPYMAAMGAMRAGAGLATIALPKGLEPMMSAKTTEVMTLGLPDEKDGTLGPEAAKVVIKAMRSKAVICIGPGLGFSSGSTSLVSSIIGRAGAPVVIDADGLNAVAASVAALKKAKTPLVLTPHPGEAARLLGKDISAVQSDRVGAARTLAERAGAVVLLKGASSVVAEPDGCIYVNPTGNPALATAGTGDVLSGIVAGLLSRGLSPVEAASCGAYLHGKAADDYKTLHGGTGMIATDLLQLIPSVIVRLINDER
ncbi:MAG: NAD(P)H-hydrate dehydratase [Deltaproteobacteria bacterium]|nr:NAD(P)H-hydrate dehydratase [Deltaproteobacteria bacterium]